MLKKILYSWLLIASLINAHEWVIPESDVHTIYFQGMLESHRQCAKYCGPLGMVATTGERVVCPTSNELIRNPYIGKELDEIILVNSGSRAWYHPLYAIDWMQQYKFAREIQQYEMQIFDTRFGMPSLRTHWVDLLKMNFGQKRDIAEHAQKVTRCDQQHNSPAKILWGVSRGAAATFNAYATHRYENVKMVVLEGCFDTVGNTIYGRTQELFKRCKLHTLFHYFLSKITEYKIGGISPIASVDHFPENIPVVFITSIVDKRVPKACTDALVHKLEIRGKNPIYYLVLTEATHNVYSLGNGEDQKKYRTFLHSLYKKYSLPYIAEYVID